MCALQFHSGFCQLLLLALSDFNCWISEQKERIAELQWNDKANNGSSSGNLENSNVSSFRRKKSPNWISFSASLCRATSHVQKTTATRVHSNLFSSLPPCLLSSTFDDTWNVPLFVLSAQAASHHHHRHVNESFLNSSLHRLCCRALDGWSASCTKEKKEKRRRFKRVNAVDGWGGWLTKKKSQSKMPGFRRYWTPNIIILFSDHRDMLSLLKCQKSLFVTKCKGNSLVIFYYVSSHLLLLYIHEKKDERCGPSMFWSSVENYRFFAPEKLRDKSSGAVISLAAVRIVDNEEIFS